MNILLTNLECIHDGFYVRTIIVAISSFKYVPFRNKKRVLKCPVIINC